MTRRLLVWGALLGAAALLAFWLQGAIQDLCIVPAIELFRIGGLFLRSVPHWVFWSLLLVGVALIALGSLATGATGRAARGWLGRQSRLHFWRAAKDEQDTVPGPIGELAWYIHNTRRGLYFKWLVAHRLSELAQAIVTSDQGPTSPEEALRDLRQRSALQAEPAAIQAYLQAGLCRPPLSQPRLRFLSRRPTTLDLDPTPVIEYLQSQMETKP
jgi:hypothetical protein